MQTRSFLRVRSLSLLVLSLGVATQGVQGAEDVIRKSVPVKAGGQLVVRADRGSLRLAGGAGGEAEIEVVRKVNRGSASDAEALIADHEVRISQEGDALRIDAASKTRRNWNWLGPSLEVEIRVTLPKAFGVDAETSGGSVHAENLEGALALRTSGGSLRFEGLKGTVRGKTSGGSIRADHLRGDVELTTSGGSIAVDEASGERLKVHTSGGSLRLTGIAAPLEAKTSGGSIQLDGSTGPVTATTSGGSISARFTAAPKAEVSLTTSAGSVELRLPAEARFDLDASTSAGSVRSDFDIDSGVEKKGVIRSSLRGPANGGGPTIRLRTSAGGIRVRKD